MPASPSAVDARDMTVILVAGSVALALSFGARSAFGVVVGPLSTDLGWPRETFALSLALQNLVWGLAQPGFGLIADRWGDRPALWLGFLCYLSGMLLAGVAATPFGQHLGTGVLVGLGISGTAFGLVLSVVGRAAPPERRSQALGLVAALGGLGQVLMPPLAQWLVEIAGWRAAVLGIGALLAPIGLCIPLLRAPTAPRAADEAAAGAMIARAFGHPSYLMLTAGFFVCGFHLSFIAAHFPAYVAETCAPFELFGRTVGPAALGALTISIIGAANVAGTLFAGWLGARCPKPLVLSAIYALRALAILLFVMAPVGPLSVVAFSAAMGFLWLATVPLTAGLVAAMFGPRMMATLYGFVFLSHQVGSFVGVWFGGRMYDLHGSYDVVWWTAIGLGLASALVHLPIRDRAWAAPSAA